MTKRISRSGGKRAVARIVCIAGTYAVLTSAAAAASPLAVLPSRPGESAAYVFDFSAEYGGYSERYHASLDLRERSPEQILVSGSNARITQDEISHTGVRRETRRSQTFVAKRAGLDAPLAGADERAGVADQVFDYNSLVTLLDKQNDAAGSPQWRGTTRCWISNTVTADVPVRISLRGAPQARTLFAVGRRELEVGTRAEPITARISISVAAVFRRGIMTRADMRAREIYERHGIPAGGGTYHWTVTLKGQTS